MKSYKGVKFVIEPGYAELDGRQTSALTTTGVYMKPFNVPDKDITIFTTRDPRYNGTVGMNIVGNVPEYSQIALFENDGEQSRHKTFTPEDRILGFETDKVGQNI
uniref:Uncharacterized protein n=1 Tax=Caenorhabditis japonica TaxID=281687 RepID=A0A8R1I136_CAEJA